MDNAKKENALSWVKKKWAGQPMFSTAIALVIIMILQTMALGFEYPSFGAWFSSWMTNWLNILRNNAGIGIIALGMTFVILSGGIDLAVGSTLVAIGAVVMMMIDSGPQGVLAGFGITGVPAYILGILIGMIFGAFLGWISGMLVTLGRIPPFIATLGIMKISRSVTQHFMQGYTPTVPQPFLKIANLTIGGQMIMPLLYWIAIAVILYIVSRKTTFGRHVYAIGSNEKAAKLSGVNANLVKCMVYVLMGLLVAVSSILQVSRIGSMDYANAGSGYEMDAIAAVIVGGTRMSGGRGSIGGTVLGTLIIATMNNLLNLMGVPPFLREAFKGLIVIAAVILQKKDQD